MKIWVLKAEDEDEINSETLGFYSTQEKANENKDRFCKAHGLINPPDVLIKEVELDKEVEI